MSTMSLQTIPGLTGAKFFAMDPSIEYTIWGFAQNETFLVVGSHFDAPNNRTLFKTFKMSDVRFIGKLEPK